MGGYTCTCICSKLTIVKLLPQSSNERSWLTSSRGCGQGTVLRQDVNIVVAVWEEVVEGEW